MQDEQSAKRGAYRQRSATAKEEQESGEVLAPAEVGRASQGAAFKRHVRARAAQLGLYGDKELASLAHRDRGTIQNWWKGARPDPDTLKDLAQGLVWPPDEVYRWVYLGGDPPALTPPPGEQERVVREGQAWADTERRRHADRRDPHRG